MGEPMKKTMHAKPRLELEELYQGIPDESVNLTFQDLAISEASIISNHTKAPSKSPSLLKPPSFAFNNGLQASNHHSHLHHDNNYSSHHQGFGLGGNSPLNHLGHRGQDGHLHHDNNYSSHHQGFGLGGNSPLNHLGHRGQDDRRHGGFGGASGGAQSPVSRSVEYSMGYDDVSGVSLASGKGGAAGRRRRPGIPHSKICTICSNYGYLFRTRCLVCGRVYCRQCVEIGMGEMIEGRKCVECLGLRFSQRYIERAGMVGFCSWRYPSTVKLAELKWAEKGPRRSGDRGYGHKHGVGSSTPTFPTSPLRSPLFNEPSFVMSATSSPHRHHLPL